MTQDTDPDGVDSAISDTARSTAMVVGYVAQTAVMATESRARQEALEATERAREARFRYEAERRAALAQLAPTRSDRWLSAAELPDLVQAWRTARGWADADPHAQIAEERLVREAQARFGIDLRTAGADPSDVTAQKGTGGSPTGTDRGGSTAEGAHQGVAVLAADDSAGTPSAPIPTNSSVATVTRDDQPRATSPAPDADAAKAKAVADANQAFPAADALAVPLDHLRGSGGGGVPAPRQRPPDLGRPEQDGR